MPVDAAPAMIRVGVLAPLSPPGWLDAGTHLFAGIELAARAVNDAGGVLGRPLELLVRDTAADPQKAEAAVRDLARQGVVGLVGEFHSVVAQVIASTAVAFRLPFICSSAVIDTLIDGPTDLIARLAPPQSKGWGIFGEYLASIKCDRIAVISQLSAYWDAGKAILRRDLELRGGSVLEIDASILTSGLFLDQLASNDISALLLLVGTPDPAVSIVQLVRGDRRFDQVLVGAPAGQPELSGWLGRLGPVGGGVPFLRYLPPELSDLGKRVRSNLLDRLGEQPSFMAFEGYDAMMLLAEALESASQAVPPAAFWSAAHIEGTRGHIRLSRSTGSSVWQWNDAPIQIADRDPADVEMFRVLFAR